MYDLLGGKVHETSTYYLYPGANQDLLAFILIRRQRRNRRNYVRAGFTAAKFDPAGPYTAMVANPIFINTAIRELCEIRQAVDDRSIIWHTWRSRRQVIRLPNTRTINPLWFEEPLLLICPSHG